MSIPAGPATAPRTVAEVIQVLERAYPPTTAEDWDRVGLSVGSPADPATRILLSVDVTEAVVQRAIDDDIDLIISHHPLLLRGVNSVRADHPKGRLVTMLITNRIALYTAHTNADIAVDGTVAALAQALGLTDLRPLRPVPIGALDKIITFVPEPQVETVVEALSAAGAGAIGDYDRCAFRSPGTGTFRPLAGATPFIGEVGRTEQVPEIRVEMIMDRRHRSAVADALLLAHPYQTPAYDITEVVTPRADTGLGRIGTLRATRSLGDFAATVAETLGVSKAAVRVAGAWDRPLRRVAVQAGAGDDLLDLARRAGADAYLTSDLRHHPALEALAWPDSPALIDVPHGSAEALWLPHLRALLSTGLDRPASNGQTDGAIQILAELTDPWRYLV